MLTLGGRLWLRPRHPRDTRRCWIEPSDDGLRLTNERGMTAAGRLQIIADGWGGLVGTIVGPQIWWENGAVWVREPRVRRFR